MQRYNGTTVQRRKEGKIFQGEDGITGTLLQASDNIDPPCITGLIIWLLKILTRHARRVLQSGILLFFLYCIIAALIFLCAPCSGINTGSNRPGTGDMIIHCPGNILLPFAQKTGNHISGRWKMVK